MGVILLFLGYEKPKNIEVQKKQRHTVIQYASVFLIGNLVVAQCHKNDDKIPTE